MELAFVIVAGGAVSLLTSYFNRTLASPVLAIVNRWLRWISYSLLIAWLMDFLALTGRPFAVLAVTALVAGACGDDKDDESKDKTTTTEQSEDGSSTTVSPEDFDKALKQAEADLEAADGDPDFILSLLQGGSGNFDFFSIKTLQRP